MTQRKYDFDTPVNRVGTACVKYDMGPARGKDADLLPLWVADMDFKIPDEAIEALQARAAHGIFGYTDPDTAYRKAVCSWIAKHQGWQPAPEALVVTPGVICALSAAINAFTEPGDAVLIQPPVYYPFRAMIEKNHRVVARAPLTYDADAMEPYSVDFEAFERALVDSKATLFILCNPHNPVGRVWRADELARLAAICKKHGVPVVSDEIHADLSRAGYAHTSFASPEVGGADNAVICTAASKAFNLAGLQTSNIFVPNPALRKTFRETVEATGYDNINTMGAVATQACYTYGEDWLRQLNGYLDENLAFLNRFVEEYMPQLRVIQPQSTYLVWVDCRALGLTDAQLERLVEKDAKLWLDMGIMFGEEGSGFVRFNIATQRATLEEALVRLRYAINDITR